MSRKKKAAPKPDVLWTRSLYVFGPHIGERLASGETVHVAGVHVRVADWLLYGI